MTGSHTRTGALVGFLTGLPLIGLFYLGAQIAELPFLPFVLVDFMARRLPGNLVTPTIDAMVSLIRGLNLGSASQTARLLEELLGSAVVLVGAALLGALIANLVVGNKRPGWQVGARIGSFTAAVTILVALAAGPSAEPGPGALWIAVLIVGWGALTGKLLDRNGRLAAKPS